MNERTQGVVLALLGAVCLRLAVTDVYLRYVNEWMRWPLLLTAGVLLALAVRTALAPATTPGGGVRAAWLLLLPALAVFVISPPALGSYAAQRHAVGLTADDRLDPLSGTADVVAMPVGEFLSRAQWDDTLTGRTVVLTGFVTRDDDGWFVTRMGMSCCAADALAYRVRVAGAASPPVDSWVRVTGSWQPPAQAEVPRAEPPPVIAASEVRVVPEPRNAYE